MNTKAIDFRGCRLESKPRPNGKVDSILLSDLDFMMNYRTNFFLFGEEKVWGKRFDTGIHTNRKDSNPGPILRAKSVINAMNKDSVWVWVWSKPEDGDVHLHNCYVVQCYFKLGHERNGTMKEYYDNPIPFMRWYKGVLKNLNVIE